MSGGPGGEAALAADWEAARASAVTAAVRRARNNVISLEGQLWGLFAMILCAIAGMNPILALACVLSNMVAGPQMNKLARDYKAKADEERRSLDNSETAQAAWASGAKALIYTFTVPANTPVGLSLISKGEARWASHAVIADHPYIIDVVRDSRAAVAGLLVGDRVVKVNGEDVPTAARTTELIRQALRETTPICLDILRPVKEESNVHKVH